MLLEVCANSYQSAINAQEAGAHRIELCQELSVGGITPSYGLLKRVIDNIQLPVFVLIRPRGGSFVYTNDEFEIMRLDIQICKDLGCSGIVSGVLNPDKTIDIKRTKELVEKSKPLSFTFHRAFDEVITPKLGLQQLIDLAIERVLTSGQKSSAIEGLDLLRKLNKISQGRIKILPGGGVNPENAIEFSAAGFQEIHSSASSVIKKGDSLFSKPQTFSDPLKIKALLDAIS